MRHEYGAWLVGDRLLADGSCFLCSPVDPAYVLLALLDARQEREQQQQPAMFQEASSLLCIEGCVLNAQHRACKRRIVK